MNRPFMIEFNGAAWAIVGPWTDVYNEEIGFEQKNGEEIYYLTFAEAAWVGWIKRWEPMGENI